MSIGMAKTRVVGCYQVPIGMWFGVVVEEGGKCTEQARTGRLFLMKKVEESAKCSRGG